MTATASSIVRQVIPLQQDINKAWTPKLINLTREEASQADNGQRVYRASFIKVLEQQKAQFQDSKCMFLISVGQHYHEGAKLEAALKWFNKYFRELVIVVGDTIQKYTYAIRQHKNPEELLSFAESEGSKWLERNMPIIKNSVTKPHKVYRWNHYAQDSKFDAYYREIDLAVQLNENGLQICLEEDAQEFLNRLAKNGIKSAPNSMELCMQYLKNECVCMRLFMEEGCEFFTYPYGMPGVIEKIREKYIKDPHSDVMREVQYGIKGKNVKNMAAA